MRKSRGGYEKRSKGGWKNNITYERPLSTVSLRPYTWFMVGLLWGHSGQSRARRRGGSGTRQWRPTGMRQTAHNTRLWRPCPVYILYMTAQQRSKHINFCIPLTPPSKLFGWPLFLHPPPSLYDGLPIAENYRFLFATVSRSTTQRRHTARTINHVRLVVMTVRSKQSMQSSILNCTKTVTGQNLTKNAYTAAS